MASKHSENEVRSRNWDGFIPTVLSLSVSSLSSSSTPAPIHLLLHRQTFLHVGLSSAVDRLAESAVVANAKYGFWFEDEKKRLPLRWHLFTGVLYDLCKGAQSINKEECSDSGEYLTPWRIKLHFTSYPVDEILSCPDGQANAKLMFKNSLKQSLYVQYNHSKITMQLSKEAHDTLWGSVSRHNVSMFMQFCKDYMASEDQLVSIPVRMYIDHRPVIQRPCIIRKESSSPKDQTSDLVVLQSLLEEWLPYTVKHKEDFSALSDE